jgi:hypothetical protein
MAILVDGEQADWELEFTNDGDGVGTNVIELSGDATSSSELIDFTPVGGVYFSSKCFLDLTGIGLTVHIWWDGVVSAA